MPADPRVARAFAETVLEELARIRAEQVAQRKLLVELLSRISKERRRKIRDRTYDVRVKGRVIAIDLKRQVGLLPMPDEGEQD